MSDTDIISELWQVINDRAANPSPESYVSSILTHRKGMDKSLEKVGEECTEFILAAKGGSYERGVSEAADLIFHLLVALKSCGINLEDVLKELESRRK
jgi:phosphoribosyl-ATP pyrophosphohydrolase